MKSQAEESKETDWKYRVCSKAIPIRSLNVASVSFCNMIPSQHKNHQLAFVKALIFLLQKISQFLLGTLNAILDLVATLE